MVAAAGPPGDRILAAGQRSDAEAAVQLQRRGARSVVDAEEVRPGGRGRAVLGKVETYLHVVLAAGADAGGDDKLPGLGLELKRSLVDDRILKPGVAVVRAGDLAALIRRFPCKTSGLRSLAPHEQAG